MEMSELMIALRNAESARAKGIFNDKYTVEACLKEVCGFVDKALYAAEHQQINDEKKIARAIIDAQAMREGSYVPNEIKWGDGEQLIHAGEYSKDLQECLIATCKKHGLSSNLWCLLNLAMHGWNDIQLWADDVLAGKNILEECEKENAKMKAEAERKGIIVDEIVNDDEALSKELSAMNDTLKAQKQKSDAAMDRVGEADEDGLETDT